MKAKIENIFNRFVVSDYQEKDGGDRITFVVEGFFCDGYESYAFHGRP